MKIKDRISLPKKVDGPLNEHGAWTSNKALEKPEYCKLKGIFNWSAVSALSENKMEQFKIKVFLIFYTQKVERLKFQINENVVATWCTPLMVVCFVLYMVNFCEEYLSDSIQWQLTFWIDLLCRLIQMLMLEVEWLMLVYWSLIKMERIMSRCYFPSLRTTWTKQWVPLIIFGDSPPGHSFFCSFLAQ